jgi:hypothetical protein
MAKQKKKAAAKRSCRAEAAAIKQGNDTLNRRVRHKFKDLVRKKSHRQAITAGYTFQTAISH